MEDKDESSSFLPTFKVSAGVSPLQEDGFIADVNSGNYPQDTIVVAEEIEGVHTEFVSRVILDASSDMYEVIKNLEAKKHNRAFEASDILEMINMPDFISVQNMFDAHKDDIRIKCRNQSILQRNLAAFGLEIKEVVADGDCAFKKLSEANL